MIYDSILVCHFPRDAFTTVNQKAAEQFLWVFLSDFNVLQISSGERWLEIQCGKSISQQQVRSLNTKLQHSIESAISDYDIMQHTKLYLKIMYEMGRLAEGVAQIINVKDSTMCHGVASELLTNIKKFAGISLPQRLQLYQQHNNQFGYMDLPDFGGVHGGVSHGFGPTAPMNSLGINSMGNSMLSFHQKQQLLNQLAQINYMQQLQQMSPYNNPIQFQPHTQPQNILLQQQKLLLQQQLNEMKNNDSKQRGSFHTKQQKQYKQPKQKQNDKININTIANHNNNNDINNEYMQLLEKAQASKNKKKPKKAKKKKKKAKKKSIKQSSNSETSSDSDDDDDSDSDSDESDDDSDDSSESDGIQLPQSKMMSQSSVPNHKGGIGLVEDDDMKYPPIPFGANNNDGDINLDPMKTPHSPQHKKSKKALKKAKKKKKKSSDSDDSDTDTDSDSDDEDDDDDTDTDSDDESDEEDDTDTDSDSDDADSDSDSDEDEDSEESSDSHSSESDETKSFKINRKQQKKFEKDLDLLLNGRVDEYIKKNMPMEIAGMSPPQNTDMNININRDELRPHSLSIQIKDVELLKQTIGNVKHENDSNDSNDDEPEIPHNKKATVVHEEAKDLVYETPKSPLDDSEILGKSRNRKLDRMLRGSKSNIEYTKRVLGMVKSDRTPKPDMKLDIKPDTIQEKEEKEEKEQDKTPSKHKQHLDNMIDDILAGKNFVPFDQNEDKARQSNEDINDVINIIDIEHEEKKQDVVVADELEQIDMEIKAAMENAKQSIMTNPMPTAKGNQLQHHQVNIRVDNLDDDDDDDVDEMFVDNSGVGGNRSFQSLIKTAIGPTAIDAKQGIKSSGHHKRQSTRLLLDSLRPSTAHGINEMDEQHQHQPAYTHTHAQVADQFEEDVELTRHITWGMILIELDNFERLLQVTLMDTEELIDIIQNLIDESLEYENQYVDHMTEGQFVLLTPVDIIISDIEEKKYGRIGGINNEYFYEKKEDRLRDIAATVLQHLSREEEQLEFCMGVALQDRVSSDQEWFEIARESLEEMKAYREFDRSRTQRAQHIEFDAERLKRRSNKYQVSNAINMVTNLDYQDENGDTALIIACGSQRRHHVKNNNNTEEEDDDDIDGTGGANINIVNEIIKRGCNVNLRNKEGMTALMFAAMNGDNDVVNRLCELGAKLEIKGITSKYTKTALLFAAIDGHKNVINTLVRYGANINCICDDDESNALMLAVNNNHIETVKYLLNFTNLRNEKIDINHQNKYGYTSLMIAAYNGNQYVVELLLNYGTNVKIKNKQNETAYSIARKANHINLCQLLLPLI